MARTAVETLDREGRTSTGESSQTQDETASQEAQHSSSLVRFQARGASAAECSLGRPDRDPWHSDPESSQSSEEEGEPSLRP